MFSSSFLPRLSCPLVFRFQLFYAFEQFVIAAVPVTAIDTVWGYVRQEPDAVSLSESYPEVQHPACHELALVAKCTEGAANLDDGRISVERDGRYVDVVVVPYNWAIHVHHV